MTDEPRFDIEWDEEKFVLQRTWADHVTFTFTFFNDGIDVECEWIEGGIAGIEIPEEHMKAIGGWLIGSRAPK